MTKKKQDDADLPPVADTTSDDSPDPNDAGLEAAGDAAGAGGGATELPETPEVVPDEAEVPLDTPAALPGAIEAAEAHAAVQAATPLMASAQNDLAALQTTKASETKGLPPGALNIRSTPKAASVPGVGDTADAAGAMGAAEVLVASEAASAPAKAMEASAPVDAGEGAGAKVSGGESVGPESPEAPEESEADGPVGLRVPGHLSMVGASESELAEKQPLPRALSVFRRHGGASVTREQAVDSNMLHHDEDNFPQRSPLSSVPFFMWGGLAFFLALIAALFLGDLARPLLAMMDDNALRPNLVSFLNACSRSVGVLLAAVITLCAIAIPLTANNYTSKLLGLFTDSKVNRSMFALLIFTSLVNMSALLFVDMKGFWPLIEVSVVGTMTFLCFVMVIPYAFYIFHFLQPDEIIRHIEREVMGDLLAAKDAEAGAGLELHRKRIIQNLKNLSNIALRSVDRHDRDTAMLSLEALRHIIHHYFAFKHEMPGAWFRVSRMYFLSLSGEMRRRVEQGKTFLEAEVMEEFSLVLSATFGKLRDMVRMIARTIRHIGVEANEKDLPAVMELTNLYFNTFLRAAISRREPEAIYMMVYQYRRMAEEMMATNKERPVQVAYYLSYYGHQAVRSGMAYVSNLISFDIAHMTALAYELDAMSKRDIFDLFLAFDEDERVHNLPGVIKSRFKLAVYLHHLGFEEEQQLLCASLATCCRAALELSVQELGQVQKPMFWEVTDRHRHNDYLAPALFRSHAVIKAQLLKETPAV